MEHSRTHWRRSSRSSGQGGQCVEVAAVSGDSVTVSNKEHEQAMFVVRDSKNPDAEPLVYTKAEWDAFVQGVKDGEFDSEKLLAVMKDMMTAD